MGTPMESHRYLLRRICLFGNIAAWTMIAIAGLSLGKAAPMVGGLIGYGDMQMVLYALCESAVGVERTLMGLAVLCAMQFIRYAIEEEAESRWLLRKGHIILFLFALSLLLGCVLQIFEYSTTASVYSSQQMDPMQGFMLASMVTTDLLPAFVEAMCVAGLALALRRALPIMAESKQRSRDGGASGSCSTRPPALRHENDAC